MPGLWAHSHFWSNAAPSTVADPERPMFGYPGWQAVTFGSGLGGVQPLWDRWRQRTDPTTKKGER